MYTKYKNMWIWHIDYLSVGTLNDGLTHGSFPSYLILHVEWTDVKVASFVSHVRP